MTWVLVSALGFILILIGASQHDISVIKAEGYPEFDLPRLMIGAFVASIPVLVLQDDNPKQAWAYIFLIMLMFLLGNQNYRGFEKFFGVTSVNDAGKPSRRK